MIEKPESIQGYNLSQKANNGFICLDEVLEPAQCVFNQQNVSYADTPRPTDRARVLLSGSLQCAIGAH